MSIRKTPAPSDTQPAGSGATPGTAEPEPTFGEELKQKAAGEQVPGSFGSEDEPMVTFHGAATRREISAAEWAGAGVADMPTVVWERRTGHKVSRSAFTDQALQVLRQDQDFRVP